MSKTYTRIPGVGTGRGSFQVGLRQRLYQGPDHLLIVQSTGFTEDYRRVFYRDVRSFVVRKTRRYIWMNVILGVIIFLLCLTRLIPLPWTAVAIFCFIPVVILIINVVRGPSCACYLTTNIQTVVLPTPQRLKKVPLLLDFLKTKVPSAPDGVTS